MPSKLEIINNFGHPSYDNSDFFYIIKEPKEFNASYFNSSEIIFMTHYICQVKIPFVCLQPTHDPQIEKRLTFVHVEYMNPEKNIEVVYYPKTMILTFFNQFPIHETPVKILAYAHIKDFRRF
jgi:hypothetical protein